MAYLAISDLLKRWTRPPQGRGVYARQSVYRLMRSTDFPAPAIDTGTVKLWHLSVIAGFENAHPELTDAAAKSRKVRDAGLRALFAARHRKT